MVTQHNFCVGADVNQQLPRLPAVRSFGQHCRSGVGPNMAGDTGPDVVRREREIDVELSGTSSLGTCGGQRERRLAERDRVESKQQVMHHRVTDEYTIEHEVTANASFGAQLARQLIERRPNDPRELVLAPWVHHYVADPAHQVFAEADLRVHPAPARDHVAGRQLTQMTSDRGGPDVNGHTENGIDEAGPDADHHRPRRQMLDRRRGFASFLRQRTDDRGKDTSIDRGRQCVLQCEALEQQI